VSVSKRITLPLFIVLSVCEIKIDTYSYCRGWCYVHRCLEFIANEATFHMILNFSPQSYTEFCGTV